MRAIHLKLSRKNNNITLCLRGFFCSQNWHHILSRWNLLSLNVVFCLCLFTAAIIFFEWSNDPSFHQTYVKRQWTIDTNFENIKSTWLLDSTVNWDSHQTKLRKLSTVLEQGKVLSQRWYQTKHNFVSTNPFHRTTARKNGTLMERGVQTQS